jgi:hypothetical protein
MKDVVLKVTYHVPAHRALDFERIFFDQVVPLAEELDLHLSGFWKTLVGNAGEYLELWTFDSMADFGQKWNLLLEHPRFQEIFKTTGPIVRNENFALFQPVEPPK